jgi:hypothetical protein
MATQFLQSLISLSAAFLLCGFSAFAQADYYVGDTIEFSTLGLQDADHAVIAVNSFGDAIVANHTTFAGHSKAVEVNILLSLGPNPSDGFKLIPPKKLGDPTLDIYGYGGDSCLKPDAEAMSDDSFIIVWERRELSNRHPSRLEICRIFTRDAAGNLLPQPTIQTAQFGEGYILDDTSTAGDGGFMPDIAACDSSNPTAVFVVYVHEAMKKVRPATTYRDYEIRCRKMNWNSTSQAPLLGNITTIQSGIAFDNNAGSPYEGGMVLPDAVFDDSGNLVVAYEQYIIAPHFGHSGAAKGTIQVRRYASSPFAEMDALEFTGYADARLERRPMLASSNADSNNRVLLGWVERFSDAAIAHRAHFRSIRFDTGAAGHTPPVTIPWDESFGLEDDLPQVAMSGRTQFLISSRSFPNQISLISSYKNATAQMTTNQVNTGVNYSWRPSVVLYDFNTFTIGFFAFEGADTNAPSLFKTFLRIKKIQ